MVHLWGRDYCFLVDYSNEDGKIMFLVIRTNAFHCTSFSTCTFRSLPIVGTMADNVRPIDRKAIVSRSKGTLAPILKWANTIGNKWVNDTVRTYRKGVK